MQSECQQNPHTLSRPGTKRYSVTVMNMFRIRFQTSQGKRPRVARCAQAEAAWRVKSHAVGSQGDQDSLMTSHDTDREGTHFARKYFRHVLVDFAPH